MIALLAMAAFFVFKLLFRRKAASAAGAGQRPLGYAGAGGTTAVPPPAQRFDARQELAGSAGGSQPGQSFGAPRSWRRKRQRTFRRISTWTVFYASPS
jgi:hypothetical protein